MLDEIIASARALPAVENFFCGKTLPCEFRVPSDILLYCHHHDWPKSIISSRYMLVFPFTDLTYKIEERLYPLQCGQAILVKPYLSRSVPHLHQDFSRLIVSFILEGDQGYLPRDSVMVVTSEAWVQVRLLLWHYERDNMIAAAFALTLLLCELSKNTIQSEHVQTSPIVNRAMCMINQHLGESFGIKDIAEKVGISVSHLRRRFRQELGLSLGGYIARHRLSAAQRLLIDTDMRIEAVANACGYASIYAFSRFFRKNIGLSPLHFRRQFRH